MRVTAFILIGLVALAAPAAERPDESAMVPHVKALSDPDGKIRENAATELRKIAAGSAKAVEQAGVYWNEWRESISKGMNEAEVTKKIPRFELEPGEIMHGTSHQGKVRSSTYRLDCHWIVDFRYDTSGNLLGRPEVKRLEMCVWVDPPANFTGKWITWCTNGQKAHESDHKNGKHHGIFINYFEDGSKSMEQNYVDGLSHGLDAGWDKQGRMIWSGQHRMDKKVGTWTWWDAGKKVREEIHPE